MIYNIRVPDNLYSDLKEAAKQKNITVAALIKLLCSEYIEKEKEKQKKKG